ncbi:MAG: hypothetical protein Q4C71_01170 [Microbacteriaceae bacterium]|nr:hypothetical protein [Microbacteriaceae bacterium]
MNRKKISTFIAAAALSAGLLSGCAESGNSSMPELPKEVKTSCQVGRYYQIMVQNGAVETADEIAKITRTEWKVDGNGSRDIPQTYTVNSRSKDFNIEQIIRFEGLTAFTKDEAKRKKLAADIAGAMRGRGWEVKEPVMDSDGVTSVSARDSTRTISLSIQPIGSLRMYVSVIKDSSAWKNAPKYTGFRSDAKTPECQIPGMKSLPGTPGASRN